MVSETTLLVIYAEKSGRNIISYTLSDGSSVTVDELRDRLLAGEEIGGVRLQSSNGKTWLRLHKSVPVRNAALALAARTRVLKKKSLEKEQVRLGFEEELAELMECI